ncbi:MAG TPA: hypothetical protein VFO77_10940, partial [Actinoplanes sp.]|nr:hypothetical protein [Actinoplanes sp.]
MEDIHDALVVAAPTAEVWDAIRDPANTLNGIRHSPISTVTTRSVPSALRRHGREEDRQDSGALHHLRVSWTGCSLQWSGPASRRVRRPVKGRFES